MSPEQIIAALKELMKGAIVGQPPRLSVEQGHLLEFTIGVLETMVVEIKRLKVQINE